MVNYLVTIEDLGIKDFFQQRKEADKQFKELREKYLDRPDETTVILYKISNKKKLIELKKTILSLPESY